MKLPDADLIRLNGINCTLARDKLYKEPEYFAVQSMGKRFEKFQNSTSQINTLENEYYSEYLSSRKGGEKNKILVIEDRDKSRNDLCSILQSEFQIIEAKDSNTAIELAYSELPDLIICELLMPTINGYGVIASLCHSTATSNIPLLLITAHLGQSDDSSRILSIFDRETVEPLTKEKLLDAVRDRLGIAIDRK